MILFIIYYLLYILFLFTCIHDIMFDVAQVSGTGVRARSIGVDGKVTVQLYGCFQLKESVLIRVHLVKGLRFRLRLIK